MFSAYNTAVKSEPEDLTVGEQLDRGIASLQMQLDAMKKERDSLSPEILAMKRSQLDRLSSLGYRIAKGL